jgi:hypothetical protein
MINSIRVKNSKFETTVRILTGLFLLLVAYKLYRLFYIHDKLNDYLFSENLLHYEGGYIRRSLIGNLFIALPEVYWKAGIMVLYSAMLVVLLAYIYRHSKNYYALLFFLCAPFGIRMVMFDFGSMYRKEFIFYLIIILVIILYRNYKNHLSNLIVVILLSTVMIMVHESFLFLGMPVVAWILYINNAGLKQVAAYAGLCVVAFLLLSHTPSVSQIQALDQFFASRNIDWSRTRVYMEFSKADTLKMSTGHFMQGSLFFYLLFFLPVIIYMLYTRMIDRKMMILLAVQMACCLALTIIAIDYGRWLSFVMVSFFICLFTYGDIGDFERSIRTSLKQKLIYVLILLFMLSIYLPHYIQNYHFSQNIVEYSFLEKISNSFSELVKENQ